MEFAPQPVPKLEVSVAEILADLFYPFAPAQPVERAEEGGK